VIVIPGNSQGNSRGNARGFSRGKVSLVLDLYRSGLTAREIALRIYGDDSRKARQRVHSIINLYGKRLGLLRGSRVHREGEVVESESGVYLGVEVRSGFVEHSRPVTNSAPFLGSYCNVRQLKASLKREEVRVVNVLSLIDRIMGPLGYPHDSMVREEAMYLARKFTSKGKVKEVAAAAAFVAVLLRRPGDLRLLIEALDANGIDSLPISLIVDMLGSY